MTIPSGADLEKSELMHEGAYQTFHHTTRLKGRRRTDKVKYSTSKVNVIEVQARILRLKYRRYGLKQVAVHLDEKTTVSCWLPAAGSFVHLAVESRTAQTKAEAEGITGKCAQAGNHQGRRGCCHRSSRVAAEEARNAGKHRSASRHSIHRKLSGYIRSCKMACETALIASNGTFEPLKCSSTKPALLLLHGFGASAMWQWDKQLAALCSEFNVFIPDLVFFGDSWTSSPSRTITFQAECMVKLMDALGVHTFAINGMSYGGFVGYRIATMCPSRVEKLILTAAGIGITPGEFQQVLKRWGASNLPELLVPSTAGDVQRLVDLAHVKPPQLPRWVLNQVLHTLFNYNVDEKIELAQELAAIYEDSSRTLLVPEMETLLVWGDHDEVYLPSIAERMKCQFGDKTSLVILKNGSHLGNDECSMQYNRSIIHFLRKSKKSDGEISLLNN